MSRVSESLADEVMPVVGDSTTTARAAAFAETTTFTLGEKALMAETLVSLVNACKAAGIYKES